MSNWDRDKHNILYQFAVIAKGSFSGFLDHVFHVLLRSMSERYSQRGIRPVTGELISCNVRYRVIILIKSIAYE